MKKIILFLLIIFPFFIQAQPWQLINTGFNFILTDVSFPPGQSLIGFSSGESSTYNGTGLLLKTVDGGNNWTQVPMTIPGLEAICFTSMNIGYIGGWQQYFAKTTDGGLTWTPISINPNIYYIKEIDFWDDNHGIVSCQGGDAYVTADGGATWTPSTGLATSFEDVDYVTSSLLFAVGPDEKIQKSVNGGLSWTTIYSGTPQSYLLGVDFYDANYGVVGGDDAKVLVTTNGGLNWTTHYAGGYALYHGVKVISTSTSYVAGTPEMLYKTIDGGTSWTSEYPSGGNFALYKIITLPDGTGLSCGSQGKILRKSAQLTASFVSIPNSPCLGDSVQFSSTSTGNITSYFWTFPNGTPANSTLQNPVVVFNSPGYSNVTLQVSDGTNSLTAQHNYTVNNYPGTPLLLYSNAQICSNDTISFIQNLNSINADSIVWKVNPLAAATATIVQWIGYSILTLHWTPGYTGQVTILCQGANSCGLGPSSNIITYTVQPSPIPPVIAGPLLVCKNSQHDYQAPPVVGDIFTWTVPSGTIIAGQGTNIITVLWGTNPGLAEVFVKETNSVGCSDSTLIQVTIDPCAGIEENPINNITVYPNPVSSLLTIENLDSFENISIYSITGSCVLSTSFLDTNNNLDLSFLKPGFYLLTIKNRESKETTFKLLKE